MRASAVVLTSGVFWAVGAGAGPGVGLGAESALGPGRGSAAEGVAEF